MFHVIQCKKIRYNCDLKIAHILEICIYALKKYITCCMFVYATPKLYVKYINRCKLSCHF